MNCPHCSTTVVAGAASCPACGFSTPAIRALLGGDWVRLERITDRSQRLSLRDTRHLEVCLDDFERAFPQCFLALYLGPLPDNLTPCDLGFWMLNHGAFQSLQIMKRNEFGIALVLDTLGQRAGITAGYALERHLPPDFLQLLLISVGPRLRKGALASAVESVVAQTARRLKTSARPAPRPAPVQAVVLPGSGLSCFEPLRQRSDSATSLRS